jgi:hypothetical protein
MIIKNVKYSFVDRKYKLGPYVDFFAELEVPSLDYDSIVKVIQDAYPEYEQVELMSYTRK